MERKIEVSPHGFYDSAPLLLDEDPDLESLFANPPIIQKATDHNREYWASAELRALRFSLTTGYLQHPRPAVRLKTLELMTEYEVPGNDQLLFDLLATDPDEAVRREVAEIIWSREKSANCEYAVNKAKDEIAFGSESHPVGPTRARKALELLVDTAPDESAREAILLLISKPWP